MAAKTNMECLEALVATLPEAIRVDIEAWGGEPGKSAFRLVPRRNAVGATASTVPARVIRTRWGLTQLQVTVRTSYTLVAPKKLAKIVLAQDGLTEA